MGNKPIVHAPIATGSTEPRDIRDRFADWCNVKDFGAKGDGLTDDSSAFLAAQASGAPAIMVPEGSYYITENIPGIFYSFGEVEKTGIGNVTIINLLANGSVPVGTVLWLSTVTVPAGFLLCNGQAVSRTTYPDLFNAIGTTYGAGDGSTTFNLPNLIDKFIEGANSNIGDSIDAGLPNIEGAFQGRGATSTSYSGAVLLVEGSFTHSRHGGSDANAFSSDSSVVKNDKITLDASKSSSIYGNSSTVQPPAVKLLPCIKAYSDVDNLGSLDVAQLENYVQNNVVHTSGEDTISDTKNFTGPIVILRSNPYIYFRETDIQKGGTISNNGYQGCFFQDVDNNNGGSLLYHMSTLNDSYIMITTYDMTSASATGSCSVSCGYNHDSIKYFRPNASNSMLLGRSDAKWKEIWCNQSSLNSSSDERIKSEIEQIPDSVLDAWDEIQYTQFHFKDSVEEKGIDNARLHTGLIAQRIAEKLLAKNINPEKYGFYLYDSWEATPEEKDEEGNITQEAVPAGDAYGLRYTEALCIEAAYQRRRADRAEARITSLEERLAVLEAKLEQ